MGSLSAGALFAIAGNWRRADNVRHHMIVEMNLKTTPSADRLGLTSQDVSILDFGAVGDGVADDTAAIRAAIASGARRVTIPGGTYLIRNVLEPEAGQHLVINGTLRLADAEITELQSDVAVGDCEVVVRDPAGFSVGEWVTLHDNRLPIQGGGRKTRRQGSGNARIKSISGNRLELDRSSARSYLCEAEAVLARQHAAIWIKHSGVRISGTGIIDGNKQNQLNTAPGRLEDGQSEDWRAASGIAVRGDSMLSNIVIEDVTVCDFTLHGICMWEVELASIRNTTCLRMHDKSITLHRCRDVRIVGNTCCDSEWEDGIMLHQRPDAESANYRILIQGNICRNNARHGIHVGANMRQVHLSNNLCVDNGVNLSIYGDNCTSTGDVAIGTTDRLFTEDVYRPNVLVVGRSVSLVNLTALGTRFVGVQLSGQNISLNGGIVGEMNKEPVPESGNPALRPSAGEWGRGSGEFYIKGDSRIGIAVVPDVWRNVEVQPLNVRIVGVRVHDCRVAIKVGETASRISMEGCDLDDNEIAG